MGVSFYFFLKLLFHCLLVSVVSDEMLDVHQIIDPQHKPCPFSLAVCKIVSVSLGFCGLTVVFLDMQFRFSIFCLELSELTELGNVCL